MTCDTSLGREARTLCKAEVCLRDTAPVVHGTLLGKSPHTLVFVVQLSIAFRFVQRMPTCGSSLESCQFEYARREDGLRPCFTG